MMRLNRLDNATSAAIHFSEALGYPTQNSFIDEIVKHPFYPSLLSLSEVLENEAGVKNFAVKIETDQLKEVNFPCLAHLQTKGGQYVLINALENDTVFYLLDGKNLKLSLTDFEKLWTGVILISESEKKVLKRKLNFNYLAQYILPVLSGLLLLFIIQKAYITTKISLFPFIGQNVILLAGLIVSVLLLIQSLGRSNAFIQQICGGDAKHNCNHILSAKAAQVTEWLSLSDLGFLYFSGSFIVLLFSQSYTALIIILVFNLMALPFTFWSVYYQWRIAKTWCRLCLMIQGLFWLQAIFSISILLTTENLLAQLTITDLPLLLLFYILPTVIWLNIKPIYQKTQQVQPLTRELNQLKFNIPAFKNLLYSQIQYVGTLPKTAIILGNPDASLTITMVSNAFCGPCATAHKFLDQWIAIGLDFKLEIVYTFSMETTDQQNQFFSHLLAIKQENKFKVEDVLHHWYHKDYQKIESWKEQFPATALTDHKIELLEQVNWCKLNEVKGTPTFYINSSKLPENYRLKDLKYVLMNFE